MTTLAPERDGTDQDHDDLAHYTCDTCEKRLAKGEPVLAFCGVDVTNEVAVEAEDASVLVCIVCEQLWQSAKKRCPRCGTRCH